MDPIQESRRSLLLAPLLAALPAAFADTAWATPLNPAQTIIRLPPDHVWIPNKGYPKRSVDMCPLTGDTTQPGLYYTLVRWWPGYMSAPHTPIRPTGFVWWCRAPGGATAERTSTQQHACRFRRAALSAGWRGRRTMMG